MYLHMNNYCRIMKSDFIVKEVFIVNYHKIRKLLWLFTFQLFRRAFLMKMCSVCLFFHRLENVYQSTSHVMITLLHDRYVYINVPYTCIVRGV